MMGDVVRANLQSLGRAFPWIIGTSLDNGATSPRLFLALMMPSAPERVAQCTGDLATLSLEKVWTSCSGLRRLAAIVQTVAESLVWFQG